MPFETDLFISYTHIDNQPLIKGQEGWVDRFQFSLASLLERWMGEKAHIWKDERLSGDDNFAKEILSQFPKTAVMLSVVSPRYIKSDWCKQEVGKFCEVAEQTLGLEVKNKFRLVKVVLAPIERSQLPHPAMIKGLGFEFYEVGSDQTPREYDPYFGAEWGEKFLDTVQKLAFQLSLLLKLVAEAEAEAKAQAKALTDTINGAKPETATTTPSTPSTQSKPTVYLAECSFDQRTARETLDVELKRHGYRVLPDQELPKDEEAYTAQVAECLRQSQLSIHLIGSAYGMVPDGPSQKSVVVLQNELAIQQSRNTGLKRLIWVPDGIAPKQKEQVDFINLLQTNADAQFGADLISSREPEAIKGAMHSALQKLEQKQAAAAAAVPKSGQDGRKMIFLICDEKDLMSTIPLNKLLKARGFDVEIPLFEGDAAAVRQTRVDLFGRASGVLVFYGEGGAQWRASIDAELRKHSGGQHDKAIYTCLAGPETVAKRYLIATEEPNVINCLEGISEAAVLPFLTAMNGVRG
ncbi:toll/interleukin-1 receptor domain-containing protein [Acidicapsa acidisoli]|uniref:toll/interleukin-1 receptor domain-containing protein n=1 Tax=Acidicapsa acidisoli TaxID=1615681 RepID=UPI0021E00762|nr:toll/interleukin-1 receptor domain-containing protein [Acidicapsa acidisoli]